MYNMNRQNEQIYGRNDMVTLDGHNKIYGSLGIAEPYVLQSQEGTSIVARGIKEGSFDDVVTEFRMFGKSEQFTTTGAQLIPFELGAEMTSEDGVAKCVPQKDGFRIELNGTGTLSAKSDIRFVGGYNYLEEDSYDEYENLPAGTYYAKISDNRFILNVIAWRGTNITLISTSTGGSFEVQDGDKFRIFIRPSTSAVDATVKAIISKQNDSVMYEPYTGGKPSPSTDYPQEITPVGDDGSIQVDVTGANLLNPELYDADKSYYGITYTKNLDGSVSVSGIATNNTSYYLGNYVNNLKNGKTYRVHADSDIVRIAIRTSYNDGRPDTYAKTVTVDKTVMTSIRPYLQVLTGNSVNETVYPMFNEGSVALPWEPCKTPQSLIVQTTNGLPGIPVTSGGNYTDVDGQQWICDEVDFKRGKYVQRVAWVTFDGSDDELWSFDNGGPNDSLSRGRVLMYGMCSQKLRNRVLCNRRIYSPTGSYDTENTCFSNRANIYIYGEKATVETESEWRQELSEKPVTVLYELETPIETDLTPEQMQQFLALRSYYPTTVVTNDEDVWMKMSYKALEMGV